MQRAAAHCNILQQGIMVETTYMTREICILITAEGGLEYLWRSNSRRSEQLRELGILSSSSTACTCLSPPCMYTLCRRRTWVLQCVAGCCSVLQCVAVCCSYKHHVSEMPLFNRLLAYVGAAPERCSVLQCVAEWCSVMQCDAVCCSVLQCVADTIYNTADTISNTCQTCCFHVWCSACCVGTSLHVYAI